MASKTLLYIAIIVIAAIAAVYLSTGIFNGSGMSRLAVEMTDPPNVPSGTQHLIVSYSSVQVHTEGANNSGWVDASGSGSVDLITLINASKTIASTDVSANSTVNLVRFNITSATITVDNKTSNVTVPNSQITISITGQNKVNSSSSAVLIDLFPRVNGHATGNQTTYMLVPAARAIVVNSNSTVSIDTSIGSTASINGGLMVRLGLGIGTSSNNNATAHGTSVIVSAGHRISNFMVQSINYSSGSVSGLLYTQYPVASNVGTATTLHIGSYIGYACDNTEFRLTSIYSNSTAAFTPLLNTTNGHGGCPI